MTADRQTMLHVPRKEATEKLQTRISKGEELLSRKIGSNEELDRFHKDTKAWSDYNRDLLRSLFTTPAMVNEYNAPQYGQVTISLAERIEAARSQVSHYLSILNSIIQRLELIPEDSASSHKAPPTGPSSDFDPVMKIPTRKHMDEDLSKCYKEATDKAKPFSLLMIDFDDLKKLNDTVGHPNADKVLYAFAQCVREHLSGKGEVYKYGGDELLAILPNFEFQEAFAAAERVRKRVELLSHAPLTVKSTVTIGVSAHPEPTARPEEVLKAADDALLQAKAAGKNRVFGPVTPSKHETTSTVKRPAPPTEESKARYKNEIDQASEYFKQSLGKGIHSAGHWEAVAYPTTYASLRINSLPAVRELIQSSTVSSGGWDFPYSDNEHTSNLNSGCQSFTNWEEHREGYRFYQSGLFIWVRAFPEDIADHKTSKGNRVLSLIKAIDILTAFALFLRNVCAQHKLDGDLHVEITLKGCKGRELAPYDASISFRDGYYISAEETITLVDDLRNDQMTAHSLDIAKDWAKRLFHIFNWNDVSDEFIERWQKRRIGQAAN